MNIFRVTLNIVIPKNTKYVRYGSFQIRYTGEEDGSAKQRNYCLSIICRTNWDFYFNLDHKNISGNKCYQKNINLYLKRRIQISIEYQLQKNITVEKYDQIASVFNVFYLQIPLIGMLLNTMTGQLTTNLFGTLSLKPLDWIKGLEILLL